MKVPEIFVPEKSLENKVEDLTEGYKILPQEEQKNFSPRDIFDKAKELAEDLGGYRVTKLVFRCKETKLIIKYTALLWPWIATERIKMYLNKGLFKKEKVFDYSIDYSRRGKRKVLTYSPGGWEKDLEKLYDKNKNENT